MSDILNKKQKLILTDKKDLEIEGVESIVAFDEAYISIDTSLGRLSVEGRGLKVDDLSKQTGKIHIIGEIDSIFYTEASKRGISKLFK